MKTIKEIIIFQAPYASLVDCGLLLQIHQPEGVQGVVPSQYYLPVFHGRVAWKPRLPTRYASGSYLCDVQSE